MKGTTSWGAHAEWYSELLSGADTYQEKVIAPNLIRLMAIAKGERVLDVGCGEGFFSRLFAVSGARVAGADISPELISLAQKKSPDISFHVAPAHAMPFAEDSSCDAASVVLALQNIKNAQEALRECSRILRSGGRLYIVLNHPSFRVPHASSWGFDEPAGSQYRRVDKYLSESEAQIIMRPGSASLDSTPSFHRPLQWYAKGLRSAGFMIRSIEEWISHKQSDSGPRAAAENRARKEIPLFMCIEAVQNQKDR